VPKAADRLFGDDEERVDLRQVLRLAVWGGLAALAVGGAVLAGRTDAGAQRLGELLGGPTRAAANSSPVAKPDPLAARLAQAEIEASRLAESVRALTDDRDRVLARLDAIERNLDVTAAIRENNTASPPPAAQASPPPAAPAPAAVAPSLPAAILTPNPLMPAPTLPDTPPANAGTPAAPQRVASLPAAEQPNAGAIPNSAAESVATRTEFGVDLGGDRTVDALRALWTSLRAGKHAALLDGLRPLVAIRESGKANGVELRLVVGPLANASAAARLCGTLAASGLACQPAVFDGQRLALR
jgi:hypothetical protein